MAQQDKMGVGFYVVVSRSTLIQQRLADGSDRELATLGRGELCGEMALINMLPRSASVVALQEVSTLVISIFDSRMLLYGDPATALKLLAVLSWRVRTAGATASL
jgi:CRP/FNR family cyclic AMP-dependent transcriptional regulator